MKAFFTDTETFTDLDAQREYAAALDKGVEFSAHGMWPNMIWHYLFLPHQFDPVLREKYGPAKGYVCSITQFRGGMIMPVHDLVDWTKQVGQVQRQLFPA